MSDKFQPTATQTFTFRRRPGLRRKSAKGSGGPFVSKPGQTWFEARAEAMTALQVAAHELEWERCDHG